MKYEIKIPNPCNEKWSKMTPTEKGAFCSSCQKEVFDFTNKSNYQLAKLLDTNKNICGKFKPKQLNTTISSLENNKYSKVGIMLGVSTLLTFSTPIFGQNKSTEIRQIEQFNEINNKKTITKKITDSIQIQGQVFDGNGGLPGVNIKLKGYSDVFQTDFDGNFSIEISNKEMAKNPILVFSYIGFEVQEIKINQKSESLRIRMIEDDVLMGDVVIVKKQNIFRRIGNLFRK